MLDVAGLGHGNHAAIIADVEDAVLLEDRTQHVLHEDGRTRVADEAALFLELLREEIDAEIAMLACLSGGGDADDLARAALKDEDVANADVVARDGDRVRRARARPSFRVTWAAHGGHFTVLLDNNILLSLDVAVTTRAVQDAVGSAVKSVAETVVLALVVVISHIKAVLVLARSVYRSPFGDLDFFLVGGRLTLCVAGSGVLSWVSALALPAAVLSLGFVDTGLGYLGSWRVVSVAVTILTIPDTVLHVDLGVGVASVRFTIAKPIPLMSVGYEVT